ncbi:hypothetical protein M405DRAFT_839303 [Rhizopogon salebrosus TDB-379]|nr:hypothetical protein M405DRAFT_839303 [Rhizopogon salebrosus TDB-379]
MEVQRVEYLDVPSSLTGKRKTSQCTPSVMMYPYSRSLPHSLRVDLDTCVPTLRPLCRFQHWFPQSHPRLRRMSLHQDEPGHHLRQKRPRILYPCASRPVLHLATPSAYFKMAGSRKRADPHTSYIPVLPPHDLSQPIPPSRSSHSHELDNHVRQTMFAAEDSSYALTAYPLAYIKVVDDACLSMNSLVHLQKDDPPARYATSYLPCTRGLSESQPERRAVLPNNAQEQAELLAFNRQLLSYRQTAEWGMRMLQGSFGRLRVPLDVNDQGRRQRLLEVCMRLSNVRAICVGINQIRSVYLPIWKANEDEQLWIDLGNLLFSDIRRHDRVAHYHLVVQTQ